MITADTLERDALRAIAETTPPALTGNGVEFFRLLKRAHPHLLEGVLENLRIYDPATGPRLATPAEVEAIRRLL